MTTYCKYVPLPYSIACPGAVPNLDNAINNAIYTAAEETPQGLLRRLILHIFIPILLICMILLFVLAYSTIGIAGALCIFLFFLFFLMAIGLASSTLLYRYLLTQQQIILADISKLPISDIISMFL